MLLRAIHSGAGRIVSRETIERASADVSRETIRGRKQQEIVSRETMEGVMKIITARPHRLLGECVRRIGALERAGKSCMFVVPAQYTLQAELEIMGRLGLKGSFLIDVLSPGRLQAR